MIPTPPATEGAVRRCSEEVRLHPENPQAHLQLGEALLESARFAEAAKAIGESIRRDPRNAQAHFLIGQALAQLQQDSDAARAYSNALNLDPSLTEARIQLAQLFVSHGNFAEAIPHLERSLHERSSSGLLRLTLAQALIGADRGDEAGPYLVECVGNPETSGLANGMLGYWYQSRGRFEESRACFEASIAEQPLQSLSYHGWFQSNRLSSKSDAVFTEALKALSSPDLEQADGVALQYALGKAFADLGEYGESMRLYDLANEGAFELNLAGRPFNRKRYAEIIDGTIAGLNRETFYRFRGIGSNRRLPILVVGMMRSGTTLVEQILSSHPNVAGAGELGYWLDNGHAAFDPDTREVSPKGLAPLVEGYINLLRGRSGGREFVVDKMPQNFQMVGLIHLAFPNAPIVHIRRNPVDTCLSIYTTAYEASPGFAHQKPSIVFAYRQYQRLVAHWRKNLPSNRFLEIDYEDLVSNFEAACKRIVLFCGLPWNEACLRPQDNQRVVSTPSLWQVRQPVYRTAVERWRLYEPWLGEFADLLPTA